MNRDSEMTVEQELRNRNNCRYLMGGVLVSVGGSEPIAVRSTRWDGGADRLLVSLEDGTEHPANECLLRSPWPVACCKPAKRNQWNRPVKQKKEAQFTGPAKLVFVRLSDMKETVICHEPRKAT